jgi:hypothetical protein
MRYLLVSLAIACASPKPTPTPTPAPSAPALPAPGIGEKCGADDACAAPATCASYLGFAGKAGPTFKTCEIKCAPETACPEGRTCKTIADGPGSVCR